MSLAEIEQLLYRKIGLDASSIGQRAISKAINTRMSQCTTSDIEHYWHLLTTTNNELKELINEVVVPETWFFRNNEPFKMLTKFVQNEWLLRETNKPLRILSIPCATGEEPYSISIALIEAGLTPSQFHVDAIDISQRNIETCKAGYYRDYSFRGVDPYIRDRFFRKRDQQYQLDILVRATINFRQANLFDSHIVDNNMPYDVVFCRNLLIYFDSKTKRAARKILDNLLLDDGILFVGQAESCGFLHDWFPSRKYPKSFALRKTSETSTRKRIKKIPLSTTRSRANIASPNVQNKINESIASRSRIDSINTTRTNNIQPSLNTAEEYADKGQFVETENICLQHLKHDKQNARAYYLLAMVQIAVGTPQKAVDYLKKVIYLEPGNVDSLMFLSTLTAEQGDPELANRYYERAQRTKKRLNTEMAN